MSTAINVLVRIAPDGVIPFQPKPLDEAVWNRWVEKGKTQELRTKTAFMRAVKLVSILALIVAAALWFQPAPYGTVLRFAVTAGAITAMFQAIRAKSYGLAVILGALVVAYNPYVHLFELTGGWQRAFVSASTVPFAFSLTPQQRPSND